MSIKISRRFNNLLTFNNDLKPSKGFNFKRKEVRELNLHCFVTSLLPWNRYYSGYMIKFDNLTESFEITKRDGSLVDEGFISMYEARSYIDMFLGEAKNQKHKG